MCSHPYILYTNGLINHKTKKKKYNFRLFDAELLVKLIRLRKMDANTDFFLIPCGKCVDCRLAYRKQWSIRLLNELKYSKNAYFLTLTYNDEHIPKNNSLCKEELQRFFKSLKEHFNGQNASEIKYFACGEYASRPHYHAIVFNLPLSDLTELFPDDKGTFIRKCSKTGETLYYSETIEKLWNKGFTDIGEVTFNSCSYVAGYVQKKLYGDDAKLYEKNGLVPPFMICSKGLGARYFLENKDEILKTNEIFYYKKDKVCKSGTPRYYHKLLERIDNNALERLKKRNKAFTDAFVNTLASMTMKEQHDFFRNAKERGLIRDKYLVRK